MSIRLLHGNMKGFFLHVRNMFTKSNTSASFDVESFQKLFKELKLGFDTADPYLSEIYRICKSMGESGVEFERKTTSGYIQLIVHMYESFPK